MQLPDAHFDVVSANSSSGHFLTRKGSLEWKRVLKKDGMIIAIDGDWYSSGIFLKSIRTVSGLIRSVKERNRHDPFKNKYQLIKNDLLFIA